MHVKWYLWLNNGTEQSDSQASVLFADDGQIKPIYHVGGSLTLDAPDSRYVAMKNRTANSYPVRPKPEI